MENTLSVAQAKSAFSEWLRRVEAGDSVVITRHGKPVAALVNPRDYERIERLRKAGPEGGLASVAGGWEGAEELVRILEATSRFGHREPPPMD